MKRSPLHRAFVLLGITAASLLPSAIRPANPPPAGQTVWLDALPMDGVTQGWGVPKANQSVQEKPLSIAGKTYARGLGTHATSRCALELSGGSDRFSAFVGVDDEVVEKAASIEFVVKGDRKTLWRSGVMRAGDAARRVDLDLRGVQRLDLIVHDAGDGIGYDHADWAEAAFEISGAPPRPLSPGRQAPYILTPPPPRTPRLNGARVFGVRPGRPLLFTIAATGDRPMTFAATSLPGGLELDPATGRISGVLKDKGEHAVLLKATNALGTAERKLRIVCGDVLALTPHMGWNSWYVWENHVTDEIIRAAADAMVSSGLADHGYTYVNIDDCWSVKPGSSDPSLGGEPRDAGGRVNSNRRFPDMKALTDYIHAKGLKAGIYTSPGPLTCAGHAASHGHEELDARRFAEWGFDFLKYDWCSYGGIAKDPGRAELERPYRLMSEMLRRQDRDIVLNLCQYGMGNVWEWGRDVGGHSWRTAGDLGLSFEGIAAALFRDGFGNNGREKFAGPGGWNDPDYLLLGYLSNWKGQTAPTPLTPDEQYTHVTLWCLLAAPLIFSGDITRMDNFTLSLLTNDEVIDVDQDPLGRAARRVAEEDETEVWTKEMEDGSRAVGLFNRDPFQGQTVTARWAEIGVAGRQSVRDLWRGKELGAFEGSFSSEVPAHGAVLVRLTPVKIASVGRAQEISLAGEWRLRLDREDLGTREGWFRKSLEGIDGAVRLPGSIQSQGFGDDVSAGTPWTGDIVDRSWFTDPAYEAYRQPGSVKVPFWLTPAKHYVGPAWYEREVEIPPGWDGMRVELFLERCHWETAVWVDGEAASDAAGRGNSLSVPHLYDLSTLLVPGRHRTAPGRHRLTIRVDNRVNVSVGANAHSVSDHTQTNWNGIVGELKLVAGDPIWIDGIQVFPGVAGKKARVRVSIGNSTGKGGRGELIVRARSRNVEKPQGLPPVAVPLELAREGAAVEVEYPLGEDALLWDEFSPALYRLEASVEASAGGGLSAGGATCCDTRAVDFGLREIHAEGTQFALNGRKIFLRGTLECCIFPLTGYPPADVGSWKRIIQACKAHGLNHIRFHSWCPPEAAFAAADELGFYHAVECAVWTAVGDGAPVDAWIRREGDRILEAYGNHPSFLLLAHGNEPAGSNQARYLGELVSSWKKKDPRRLYTSGSGWPMIPESDYHVTPEPRIHHWGHGLRSRINARPPETETDYRDLVGAQQVPVIAHEIGQWCVYPSFDEIRKYTGVLKASNFEIFRDGLAADHMLDRARDFLAASGKLQVLCYKEEIESALRTPGMGGFQLLDLHDFPGQGTALVGVLDPFWDSKGYVTPEEYRRFAGETVPLARMAKRILTSDETFSARIEVAHYGPRDLENTRPAWKVRTSQGAAVASGELDARPIPTGALTPLGRVSLPLRGVPPASKLTLEVSLEGSGFTNDWDFWVYPAAPGEGSDQAPGVKEGVRIVEDLDDAALAALKDGGKVLFLPPPERIRRDRFGRVPAGFSSIFWNTAWTGRQAPQTLGILCDPKHPALEQFPTEFHSNWQWWELVTRAHPFTLNDLPPDLRPMVWLIDDWVTHRRLGLVLEARVGGGRLLACGIDLRTDLERRPVARQLRRSLLAYMAGESFQPSSELDVTQVKGLLAEPSAMRRLGARVIFADSESPGYEAPHAIDGDPTTSWHTQWEPVGTPFPHEIRIELERRVELCGLRYLPRQDVQNGWFSTCELFVSEDGKEWGEPAARGSLAADASEKLIRFDAPRAGRFLRLVALSGTGGKPWAAIAELEVIAARGDCPE